MADCVPQCRIVRKCGYCGKAYCSRFHSTKYCSVSCACRSRGQKKRLDAAEARKRVCKKCGNVFASRDKQAQYCSIACSKILLDVRVCPTCSREFRPRSSLSKYCSLRCRDSDRSEVRHCLQCGKNIRIPRSVLRRGGLAGNFCSKACLALFRGGSQNPNWRGGGSYWRGAEWQKLRDEIRRRDNYQCRLCGAPEKNRRHDVHHRIPFRVTGDNSPENLLTLCLKCHRRETGKERSARRG